MIVALIGCTNRKEKNRCKAKEMYSKSDLFCKELNYAEKIGANKIYVLSAKHHLLDLEHEIYPYDETLYNKPISERRKWAQATHKQIKETIEQKNNRIIFLCGQKYYEFLEEPLKQDGYNCCFPLKGKRIGEQKTWLKNQTT